MKQRRDAFNEINITPLTDIFLVLLIIMMVIAPMLDTQGMKLAVPSVGSASGASGQSKSLAVRISAAGQYSIDGQAVPAQSIQQRFYQEKNKFPDGLVLKPEAKAPHGAVVAAMDAARSAEITKIAVVQAED